MKIRPVHLLLLALLLTALSAAVYAPWLDNPLVFDDRNLLKSVSLLDYAQVPFSFNTRQFPYFTLGFEYVVSNGNLHVSRSVALVLHALNGFMLYLLAQRLFARALTPRRAVITALSVAAIFVVHPVAVYGVAYLVQRTILFATFFLLLSALQFDQALSERSWRRALFAGVCFGAAAMAKEHAVTGLVSVMGLVWLHKPANGSRRAPMITAFLATALPCALFVVSQRLGYLGNAYEPNAQALISAAGFPDAGSRLGNWMLSAALQCLFFFRYLGLWWWPNPAGMSIDIRPDFSRLAHFPWLLIGPVALAALAGAVGFALAAQRARPELKLTAYGLLWALGLFLIEPATVRFQEAIVLYRSYLWAPGFLLALAGLVSLIPARLAAALATVALLAVLPVTWGRLDSFSAELKLWQEAASKLSQPDSAGAIRIHYNLGTFYLHTGKQQQALDEFDWVIRQDPQSFEGFFMRGWVRASRNELLLAVEDLQTVTRLNPDFGIAHLQLGLALSRLGKTEESHAALARAEALGMPHVDVK